MDIISGAGILRFLAACWGRHCSRGSCCHSANIPACFAAPSAPAWTSLGRAGRGSAAGRVLAEAGKGGERRALTCFSYEITPCS